MCRSGHHVHELVGRCAGQAVMCMSWGGGAPVRRGRSGHHVLEGWRTSQVRPVKPPCAGEAACWSGEAGADSTSYDKCLDP